MAGLHIYIYRERERERERREREKRERKEREKREWQCTPVLLLGELHGQRSPAGYSPWDHTAD